MSSQDHKGLNYRMLFEAIASGNPSRIIEFIGKYAECISNRDSPIPDDERGINKDTIFVVIDHLPKNFRAKAALEVWKSAKNHNPEMKDLAHKKIFEALEQLPPQEKFDAAMEIRKNSSETLPRQALEIAFLIIPKLELHRQYAAKKALIEACSNSSEHGLDQSKIRDMRDEVEKPMDHKEFTAKLPELSLGKN